MAPGSYGEVGATDPIVTLGLDPAAFTHRLPGGLALTTKRLSSRHSLPGPIGVGMATPYYACVRCAARALGPGGKPRDDSGGVARAAGAPLNVQRLDEAGVFLDEGEAQLRLAPPELLDQLGPHGRATWREEGREE